MNALKSHKSLYDLVVVDSKGIEMDFANQLESRNEVAVYTKLPNGFYINTPVGHYNPDWAVVFHEGSDIKHIYFVAETKGYDKDSLKDYRRAESVKIECASRHFATISDSHVTYDVVKNYDELGILSQNHKNLTQFCNLISGGNCDILQVSARN